MQKLTNFKPQSVICKLLLKIFLSVCIIFSICVYHSFADVPCMINYQGRLIENNVPVSGPKTMVFSIYDNLEGGSELWTSGNVDITVHNGLFRHVLGEGFVEGSPVADLSSIDWTAGQVLYLEVTVGGETLSPREPIYAYPYAINSHLLEGKTTDYFINKSGETQQADLSIEGTLEINASSGNIDALKVHSGDTYGLYVSTAGNVGIGTTRPAAKLEVNGRIAQMGYYTHVGAFEIPVDFEQIVTDWTKVNERTCVGFRWSDYNDYVGPGQQLYTRMCMSFTDSGTTQGPIMRIKDRTSDTVYYTHIFEEGVSASGLIHHSCGDWVPVSSIRCGYSWHNCGVIEVDHPEDVNVYIQKLYMEVAVK